MRRVRDPVGGEGAPCRPRGHRGKQPGHCWAPGSQRVARGFPGGSVVKNLSDQQEPWAPSLGGEDPLVKEMASTPEFLPGRAHGQRSLGYGPWGREELAPTGQLHNKKRGSEREQEKPQ